MQAMALLATLQSPDEELRAWTYDVLQAITTVPAEFAAQLAEYCLHSAPPVASWACKLLAKVEDASSQYQAVVVHALAEHPEICVRQEAAFALANFASLTDATLLALQTAAVHEDPRLSRLATATMAVHKP